MWASEQDAAATANQGNESSQRRTTTHTERGSRVCCWPWNFSPAASARFHPSIHPPPDNKMVFYCRTKHTHTDRLSLCLCEREEMLTHGAAGWNKVGAAPMFPEPFVRSACWWLWATQVEINSHTLITRGIKFHQIYSSQQDVMVQVSCQTRIWWAQCNFCTLQSACLKVWLKIQRGMKFYKVLEWP